MAKKKITFGKVIDNYKLSYKWEKLAPNSKIAYINAYKSAIEFHELDINDITRSQLADFFDYLSRTPAKCHIAYVAIRNIFTHAADRGWIDLIPMPSKPSSKVKKPIKPWEIKDVMTFIDKSPHYLARAVALAFYTGQRRSDLIKMKYSDYKDGFINITQIKTKKELTIAVHDDLAAILAVESCPKNHPYLIWNSHGDPWSDKGIYIAIKRQCKKLGLPDYTIHGLRKSLACALLSGGATLVQIGAMTGHSAKEAEYYSKGADTRKISKQALDLLER